MTINPDFNTIADVILPTDAQTGWAPGVRDEQEAIDTERRAFAELEEDFPVAFKWRAGWEPIPEIKQAWDQFQADKGRFPGSMDLSLIDQFAFGIELSYLPQIIGSCVASNTFPGYVERCIYEIALFGQPEEYLGTDEFGPNSFAFFAPQSYGMARKRANMRGGDGLYCAPMAASMLKDGVLACNTPKLQELLASKGFRSDQDCPEPQGRDGAQLYRQFGDWAYIEDLRQYCDNQLLECPEVRSEDMLWDALQDGKPCFVCSMEAIHKVGEHPDGFPIHARNPRDRWAHNMRFNGCFVASDGERFFRQSNQSWGANHVYNRRFDEVAASFRAGRLTSHAIGEINGTPSMAPTF